MAIASTSMGSDATTSSALRAAAFLVSLALASASALPTASADDCGAASETLNRAQAALSKAMRDADTRADAYAQCMADGGNCGAKKAAYEAALAAKGRALAALKVAAEQRKAACR